MTKPNRWADAIEASLLRTDEKPASKATGDEHTSGALSIERVSREAALCAPGPFGYLLWVDAKCIAAGMPPLSPWWRSSIELFYLSGKRWGIFCVGRGGGKSSSLERFAATECYFAPRAVPPGQTWVCPFISVSPQDATRRLRGNEAVYRALGLRIRGGIDGEGEKVRDGIKVSYASPAHMDLCDVRGNAIQLLSVAGTIGNVSGPSTIGGIIDEAAKLLDKAVHANPLTEIMASFTQTFRARPGIRAICCSSAFDRTGMHFHMIDKGDTETNHVARIGRDFLDAALRGFEQVAAWEQHHKGNLRAAAEIRTHAASLTAESPLVPTWVANPTLGSPDAQPWDGAAVASRIELEAIPEGSDVLEGLAPHALWLRECGSLPMDRSAGYDARAQLFGLAEANAELQRHLSGQPSRQPTLMTIPGAPPGDVRYAGRHADTSPMGDALSRVRLF